ncbi:hypothetical protein BO79DRAFT_160474 [Aspergillus costaricaensis CBS 115574]|uniref:Uncharacterized protein n=1 Tax=Aspergillus costaricaensis CBS 115574 TaxID=1448317 RepID=A0ACD1HZ90_9EURO|nr:hypothetical protein BO79DRAFT_160474 [Aspergillus costaricaensis CBS 115574]RAK83637.1 hypothetical protein BO79DRAFT_160474 [Aspergillus costaricaensis CBS 115574]
MNPFDELPYEILSIIITEAADWVALESLLQVSSRVRSLFAGDGETPGNREAIHIVKSMLKANSMMHHDLHGMFCKCIALRQSSLAVTSLEQFRSGDYDQLSVVFKSFISQASLREMVHVAANIQRLACACLTTFLSRIRGVKPMCHMRYGGDEVPYEPREAGPPSWIEEFRVYRALWHFQFYSDLLGAAERLKFPQEDLELLRTKPLVWNNPSESLQSELLSVNEWLWGMFCEREESFTDIPAVKRLLSSYPAYVDPLPDPSQLQDEYSVWTPPALPIDKDPNDIWRQGSGMAKRRWGSTGLHSYYVDIDLYPSTRWLHFCYIDSPIHREIGLTIWDRWRLYCLGIWYASDPDEFRWEYLGPDGSLVPQGCFPEGSMLEAAYRLSFFIKPRVREREEFCEKWSREKHGLLETSRAEETGKVERRIRRKRKACQIGLELPRQVQTRYQLRPR